MKATTTAVVQRRHFAGPNVDLPCASVRLVLDPERLPAARSIDPERLRRLLQDRARRRRDDELSRPLRELLAHGEPDPVTLVVAVAVELQRLWDEDVDSWRVGRLTRDGRVAVAYAAGERDLALLAGDAACELVAASASEPGAMPALEGFLHRAAAVARDDMMRPILAELGRRGIPFVRLMEGGRFGRHVRLGHGRHQRQVSGTITDRTSAVASMVTGSKRQTVRLLEQAGIPVPRQTLVGSLQAAQRAAEATGYPVVVKPDRGTGGKGITAGVRDRAELEGAFERARAISRDVVVEAFLEGEDHRLFVCGGRLVAATQRRRAQVVGDGRRSVRALIDEVNADPRRGQAGVTVLVTLVLDPAMLALLERQGLRPDSVPAAGQTVLLRTTSNLKSGGTPVDVTELIHPDNRAMAETAAAAVGVDIAGVDFVTPDVSRSHHEVGGAVVEVNISPSVNYYELVDGDRWGVTRSVVEHLFPPGVDGRMPLVVVVAEHEGEANRLARVVVETLRTRGHAVAWNDGRDVRLGTSLAAGSRESLGRAAETILAHPRADAGVLALPSAAILRSGLPWPDADLALFGGVPASSATCAAFAAVARCVRSAIVSVGSDEVEAAVRAGGGRARRRHLAASPEPELSDIEQALHWALSEPGA